PGYRLQRGHALSLHHADELAVPVRPNRPRAEAGRDHVRGGGGAAAPVPTAGGGGADRPAPSAGAGDRWRGYLRLTPDRRAAGAPAGYDLGSITYLRAGPSVGAARAAGRSCREIGSVSRLSGSKARPASMDSA